MISQTFRSPYYYFKAHYKIVIGNKGLLKFKKGLTKLVVLNATIYLH